MSRSIVGDSILLAINFNESRSVNELKRGGFNAVTVTRQLRRLEGKQFVRRQEVRVRGGWQHRYYLTDTGKQWLANPVEAFRAISEAVGRILATQPSIESQLDGSDLNRKAAHSLVLTVALRIRTDRSKLRISYEMDNDWNVTRSKIKYEPVNAFPEIEKEESRSIMYEQ